MADIARRDRSRRYARRGMNPLSLPTGRGWSEARSENSTRRRATLLGLGAGDAAITPRLRQCPIAKIFRFAPEANQFTDSHRLVPLEGRIAIVTDAGRDAVDARASGDVRGWQGGS